MEAVHVEETLKVRNLLFYVNQDFNYPVQQCNMTRVKERSHGFGNRSLVPSARRIEKQNNAHNFAQHAIDATHRIIKAFRLAQVPIVIASGTLLGWYRECGIIAHTNDLDFAVVADHIVSLEHHDLLMVRSSPS